MGPSSAAHRPSRRAAYGSLDGAAVSGGAGGAASAAAVGAAERSRSANSAPMRLARAGALILAVASGLVAWDGVQRSRVGGESLLVDSDHQERVAMEALGLRSSAIPGPPAAAAAVGAAAPGGGAAAQDGSRAEVPENRVWGPYTGALLAAGAGSNPAQTGGAAKQQEAGLSDPPAPSIKPVSTSGTWYVRASNSDYGEFTSKSRALYGFDLVAEPYRTTRFEVVVLPTTVLSMAAAAGNAGTTMSGRRSAAATPATYSWTLSRLNKDGSVAEEVVSGTQGMAVEVELTAGGANYSLTVSELGPPQAGKATVVSNLQATVACRYVRRELRQLTKDDRDRFMAALLEYHSLGYNEGREKYGESFTSYEYAVALHNDAAYCYHNGIQFITAHWAFNLMLERSLQIVDPKVSLAYWDFMYESDMLGDKWYTSEVFGEDMFGDAVGSPDNNFAIMNGKFKGIKNVFDSSGGRIVPLSLMTQRNAYGMITQLTNVQDSEYVSRTHSFCGVTGSMSLANCRDFTDCFESNSNLFEWEVCMEDNVHSDMHSWIGGAWDCPVDLAALVEETPEITSDLITFSMRFVMTVMWKSVTYWTPHTSCPGVNECIGSTEACACTCDIDTGDLTDEQVYKSMQSALKMMTHVYGSEHFLATTDDGGYWLMQDGVLLSDEAFYKFLRALILIGCTPSPVGAMQTGASPADPIFWVLHPIFDKALHVLALSPQYTNYDLTWSATNTCTGAKEQDQQPFSRVDLGLGERALRTKEYMTNAELWQVATAASDLPYVYDNYDKWGTCSWDACPTCV